MTQNISWILPEKYCWFDSSETEFSEDCFIKGQIQSLPSSSSKILLSYQTASNSINSLEIPLNKVYETNEFPTPLEVDDLVNLPCFNEPELLHNLKVRYKNNIIFTFIGPTLLIINPYKLLPIDFSTEMIQKYKSYALSIDKFQLSDNPPHIFANAGLAYRQLFERNRSQALVISGESGAGKTESVKYTMKFLAALSSSESEKPKKKEMAIEDKIVNCSKILEAFGNAKTIRNYNSSRFGKYVRIWMDKTSKKIVEADIINYLLEKSRVSIQSLGERNYHIFYHLLKGGSQKLLDKFLLKKDMNYYNYLNKSGCYEAENIDDVALFQAVCDCFEEMKFEREEIDTIWAILSAILKIGNLEFDDAKKTDNHPCKIINEPLFNEISELLSIEKEILRSALTIKTRITDKEQFLCPLEKNECVSVADSFSKCLYDKVCNWIIKRLNLSIRNDKINNVKEKLSIGLLDIFGFEDFKINSLEQFCINFTNEKLQQLYINYIFKSEQKEFIEEGLESYLGQISYQDNQSIIDLFDKPPFGIFLLLDESTTLKSSEDKRLLESLVKTHKSNNNFKAPKSIIATFGIIHSAKAVEYTITDFRKKNKDEISLEIENAITNSKNIIICNIYLGECFDKNKEFPLEESKETMTIGLKKNGKSIGGNNKFLGIKFRSQMKLLMEELMSCDAHFIRCFKPNEEKKSDFFVPSNVLLQIRYLGLLDSIKIRKNTYPARKDFKEFYRKYQVVLKSKGCRDYTKEIKSEEFKFLSEEIMKIALGGNRDCTEVLCGKSKIYMKGETEDELDRIFLKIWKQKQEYAKLIIKQYRIYKMRKEILEKLKIISKRLKMFRKFQAICKGVILRRKNLRHKKAIKQIIKIVKVKVLSRTFKKYLKIINEMKRSQIKKKAAQLIFLIKSKIMKKFLCCNFKKFRNSAKMKSQWLINLKKQKEQELLEKLKKEEEMIQRKLKEEEEKIMLEKKKKEEEEVMLKKKLKDEEDKRLLLEKEKEEVMLKKNLRDEEDKRLLLEKEKEEAIKKKKRKDEEDKRLLLEKEKEEAILKKKLKDEEDKRLLLEKEKEEAILKKKLKEEEDKRLFLEKEKEETIKKKKEKDEEDKRLLLEKEKEEAMLKKKLKEEEDNRLLLEKEKEEAILKKKLKDEDGKRLLLEKEKEEAILKKKLKEEDKRLLLEKEKEEAILKKKLKDEDDKRLLLEKENEEAMFKKKLKEEEDKRLLLEKEKEKEKIFKKEEEEAKKLIEKRRKEEEAKILVQKIEKDKDNKTLLLNRKTEEDIIKPPMINEPPSQKKEENLETKEDPKKTPIQGPPIPRNLVEELRISLEKKNKVPLDSKIFEEKLLENQKIQKEQQKEVLKQKSVDDKKKIELLKTPLHTENQESNSIIDNSSKSKATMKSTSELRKPSPSPQEFKLNMKNTENKTIQIESKIQEINKGVCENIPSNMKFTSEIQKPTINITTPNQNPTPSFQDRLKMFNQPKSANEPTKAIPKEHTNESLNNKLEIFNKAPNKSNEQKDEKKLLTPVKPNVNQLENLQDRTKFKSVMAKFNSPTTLSNEVKLEETKKNTSNIPVKPSQINIFQKNKETANVPGKILKTWENPKEQNPSKPQIEDPIKIEGNSVIKEKIEGFKKSNEKKEPSVDTLKVVDQVSVKKLSANLSMMNLPFRNYPGPAIKPPVISEKEIEQTQIINDDFNNVMMDRVAVGKKRKVAKKTEEFDFE